jgi:hypothetical protein
MGYKFEKTARYDALGRYQQPILDAVSKSLPGAASHYAPLPQGKPALVVVWPGFENRNDGDRKRLVQDSILAALLMGLTDYVAGIHCFTPE